MRLEDRRILISGAASGIGLSTAALFREHGADVGLIDIDGSSLDTAAEELAPAAGGLISRAVCDIADAEAVSIAVDAIAAELGHIDGIVSAAGVDCARPFADMTAADWDRVIAVNLNGPFHLCHSALPYFPDAGGTIVAIASGAAIRPLVDRTAYCASKAGLVMFTKALAVDVADARIRVNSICPGVVDTPMFRDPIDASPNPEAAMTDVLDRYLIKQLAQPRDIAHAALFLTGNESAHMTGSTLTVDGGRTFH